MRWAYTLSRHSAAPGTQGGCGWADGSTGAVEPISAPLMKLTSSNINCAVRAYLSNKEAAIQTYGRIEEWDTSAVTSMAGLFCGSSYAHDSCDNGVTGQQARSFDADISKWITSRVTTMKNMLLYATSFNQDISGWDVSKLTNTDGMLKSAASFDQDLSRWNVSKLNTMKQMFSSGTCGGEGMSDCNQGGGQGKRTATRVSGVANRCLLAGGRTLVGKTARPLDAPNAGRSQH